MKLTAFIFAFILSTFALAAPTGPNPGLDIGVSGTIPATTTKNLRVINVQKNVGIGYEINVTGTTGTITAATATLQCSNDGVNFANLPLKASGDATKSVSIVSGVGVYFLQEDRLNCNYAQVLYYSGSGGGTVTVTETAKVHGPNY